ncbi:BZ3500_MvSof-1268-A1-R1_Chr10-1g02676 [Microbotryum saponariae]|uniref:BZ3500_MvSof-1268-A1-R1_Chr10-1g02676 protein n=1 Tax=Microbotryum saponariae TaxID=289078 RepID=A0A2X0L9Q4_9BASI|nr:BZ3500_MvSof-1268-A1-R1_Chr10-1g02676 [Microbotryum saponariae]SDA06165.1 BZ3501_MvSof-1269-A2-R1_Chr10-1g02277 [Microbotryum saponariae]
MTLAAVAFQSMMSGAECSTGASPLSSLLKQQAQDHSLHQSGLSSQPGPSSSMRSGGGGMHQSMPGQMRAQEADRFFEQSSPAGNASFGDLQGLRRELDQVARSSNPVLKGDRGQFEAGCHRLASLDDVAPELGLLRGIGRADESQIHDLTGWASQYQPAGASLNPVDMAQMEQSFRMQHHGAQPNELSAEFWRHHQQQRASPGPSIHAGGAGSTGGSAAYARTGFAPSYGAYGGGMSMRSMPMMGGSAAGGMYQPSPTVQQDVKGKGRFVELDDADWEAQFARAGESAQEPAGAVTEEADQKDKIIDDKAAPLDTINLLDGDLDIDASESDAELLKELEKTWQNLQGTLQESSSISDAEMAAWEAQYGSQFVNGDDGEFDLPDMRKIWTKDNVDGFLQEDLSYPYATENEYLHHPDPFAEGQRLLAEGAPLSEAALAFEAACKLDPSRAEAWKAAGETWAADEREVKGIRALEKAVACGGPDGVGAWMSLAVAYVNEGQELRALATLEKWLTLAYPTLSAKPGPLPSATNPWDASNRIIDLFLEAARAGPMARVPGQSNELTEVDPDVQVGIGVLFYSNSDYERAKDCFESALSVRPTDFLLWNRLGATLANGGLPEEAISAYRKALDLRPTFTRAIYNLGVSCLNIGCYHEAAEHLLAAIDGQMTREKNGSGPSAAPDGQPLDEEDGSANLWHTLRRAFLCMERHDLADKAHAGTPLDEFRSEGLEF